MGVFDKILDKLGLKKDQQEESPAGAGQADAKSAPVKRYPASSKTGTARSSEAGKGLFDKKEPAQAPMEMVDVRSKLETMAKGTNLDWKVSIVDLLKVLGIDSSLEARKELATELGAPPEIMQDNVKMNVWLHKTVLAKIAQNGGNVPPELLD
jgi:hypothetical protein